MSQHPLATTQQTPVFSIGHWQHPPAAFVALLQQHGVTKLVDVRSSAASQHNPQFNGEPLRALAQSAGIGYEHCKHLGGRERGGDVTFRLQNDPTVSECLLRAIDRPDLLPGSSCALAGSRGPAVCALMCSEAKWNECHRQNLCEYASSRGVPVFHIWPDGKLEQHVAGVTPVRLTQKDRETEELVARQRAAVGVSPSTTNAASAAPASAARADSTTLLAVSQAAATTKAAAAFAHAAVVASTSGGPCSSDPTETTPVGGIVAPTSRNARRGRLQ